VICYACQKEMLPRMVEFGYLGHSFRAEALACPECGQVYIPEDLAKGRISEVEMQLEDK
jgi:hypothetical protein